MSPYRIDILREGFCNSTDSEYSSAGCTISLVYGSSKILFDPGSPWDRELVKTLLKKHELSYDDINYVICSHGHVDHVGNLIDFPMATIFVGTEIMRNGSIVEHQFSDDNPYIIDENVRVISTPGHTNNDVSLVVEKVPVLGNVVLSGDIFENQNDRSNPEIWRNNSLSPDLQERSRRLLLSISDYIVPGHGPMFKV